VQGVLLEKIESLRCEMYRAAKDRRLTDSEVVEKSRELDRLLNEYLFSLDKNQDIFNLMELA